MENSKNKPFSKLLLSSWILKRRDKRKKAKRMEEEQVARAPARQSKDDTWVDYSRKEKKTLNDKNTRKERSSSAAEEEKIKKALKIYFSEETPPSIQSPTQNHPLLLRKITSNNL